MIANERLSNPIMLCAQRMKGRQHLHERYDIGKDPETGGAKRLGQHNGSEECEHPMGGLDSGRTDHAPNECAAKRVGT